MEEENNPGLRENPQAFLDGLVQYPIDFSGFETEDGNAFVYSAIDSALDKLSLAVAKKYAFRLRGAGYDVKWSPLVKVDILD